MVTFFESLLSALKGASFLFLLFITLVAISLSRFNSADFFFILFLIIPVVSFTYVACEALYSSSFCLFSWIFEYNVQCVLYV